MKANKTYGYDAKLPLVCEVYLLALGAHLQAMKDAKERRERGENTGDSVATRTRASATSPMRIASRLETWVGRQSQPQVRRLLGRR